jgi:3-dehydroquinate dehydratase
VPVDPYADEPTAPLDPVQWALYQELLKAMAVAETRLKDLRASFEEQIGEAHAGTVDGKKVVTNRPKKGWNTTLLKKEYGELTMHFMREETKDVLDMELFAKAYPDIAQKFQTREFRVLG